MRLLYAVSFLFSLFGLFGVGQLFAGAPAKGVHFFVAGIVWDFLAGTLLIVTASTVLLMVIVAVHVVLAHLCALHALKIVRGEIKVD